MYIRVRTRGRHVRGHFEEKKIALRLPTMLNKSYLRSVGVRLVCPPYPAGKEGGRLYINWADLGSFEKTATESTVRPARRDARPARGLKE